MFIVPFIFLIYGILSPVYFAILKGKLSNEKAFLFTWTLSPFIISYVYNCIFTFYYILIISNFIFVYASLNDKLSKYLWNGVLFLVLAFLIEFIYKIF